MRLFELYENHKDTIPYVFFGCLTTLVNVVTYWLFARLFDCGVMPSTIIAWIVAVTFAYITNRKWVFHSESHGIKAIVQEMLSFFTCRLLTGFIDWLCMFVFVDVLELYDVAIKTGANLLVIIMNYIASKYIIFKH